MNPADLLGKTFDCECGRRHAVEIRAAFYADNAVQELTRILAGLFGGRRILLLADRRTFAVAGKTCADALASSGWQVKPLIVPDRPGRQNEPVCDDFTLDFIKGRLIDCDFYFAVGSGVINDLTKWLAAETKKPYAVFATAASMNGYSSGNIAPTIKGVKRLIYGTVPRAVVAAPAIIGAAPYALTTAGLGDAMAKPVSITDWRASNIIFGEYFCPLCAGMISRIEPAYMERPEAILKREPAAIAGLFNALLYSGLSMTIAGTSSPSSGGEHMISHALDSTALERGIPHDYHGRQVGLGTIFASALYERILAEDRPRFRLQVEDTNVAFWRSLAPVVEEEHALKRRKVAKANAFLQKCDWDELRATLQPTVRKAAQIRDCLESAGAACRIADIGCDRSRFLEAAINCHQMRERYTCIDLARALGIMPNAASEIIEEYLT